MGAENLPPQEAAAGPARIWSFGDSRLDERTLKLTVRGQPVRLHRKSLLVLQYLLQHSGEAVAKDELAQACWPRRILSDTVLTSTLNRLRQAIGDDKQEIVKTIHGIGYLFKAAVRVEEAEPGVAPRLALNAGDHPPLRSLWSLVQRLGGGGSGELWLARHDKTGDERVYKFAVNADAFKAIKREITLYRLLRQSVGERADLVRVFDWNLEQSPFFLELEYVAGGDVRQWSQAQGGLAAVPLATRLDIMAQCAEALAVAHGVGVLHKDMKPSNVLVADNGAAGGPAPRIKLADFGSGALLDAARLEKLGITRLGYTLTGGISDSISGTPLYLPPEVLAGQPATMQADIYALGVMLYQAVAGDWKKPLASGWEREVPDALLREDIAAAVDGDPARRLADAAELARRLRSLDARREQRASEEAERERAQRLQEQLARSRLRRRWMIAAMAALTLGLIATLSLYWRLYDSERGREAALMQARNEATAAEQINDYLTSLFDVANPEVAAGIPIEPRALVDAGMRQLAERFRDQPLQRARLLGTLGSLYCKLGFPEDCRKNLEEALALEEAGSGADPLITAQQRYWLAQAHTGQGRWDDAEKLLRAAIAVLETRLAPTDSLLVSAQTWLGDALRRQQKTTQSIAVLEKLRATLRTPQGEDSLDMAAVDGALANTYLEAGRSDEALQLQQERLRTTRALTGPDDVRYMAALANWGTINRTLGHLDVAEQALREAVAGYQRLLGDDADATIATQNGLMAALQSQGKNQEALQWARRIVDGHRGRGGTDTPSFASNLGNLGEILEQLGYYEEALPLMREAYAILQRHYGEGSVHTHITRLNTAHVLILMHQHQEALALLTPEIPPSLEGYSVSFERARRLLLLGDCYADMGRSDEARRYYDATESFVKASFKPNDAFATIADGFIGWGRARLLLREERYQDALPRLRDLIERFSHKDSPDINRQATVLRLQMELAQTLVALHQTAEATALMKSHSEAIGKLAPTHPAYQNLQRLQAQLGTGARGGNRE